MNDSRASTACAVDRVTYAHGRRSIDMSASVLMTLFCLVLGFQQVAIKAVAADVSPLAQIALRSLVAAALVGGLVRWRGIGLADLRARLGPGLLVGLGFTAEFAFVAFGLNYTLASHMSVFLYTAPVFAALGLHFLVPGEQLVRRQWWGIALAFVGMVIAMAPTTDYANAEAIVLGDVLGLLAGLSWAATTLVLRRSALSEAPAEQTLCYQLSVAALLLLPAAIWIGDVRAMQVSRLALASLSFQALVISFGALLLWFSLLRRYWASQLGVFSFLSPVFGVLFGAVLLNEPLTASFMIGGGVILGGIVLVTR
jgi:drug/metabolite transporter (DMT)-like permease